MTSSPIISFFDSATLYNLDIEKCSAPFRTASIAFLGFSSMLRSLYVAIVSVGCFSGIFASTAAGETTKSGALGVKGLQDVFQVQTPLRTSYESPACEQVILQHEFAASYGTPYVGTYSPPKNCTFTTTIFNMSVVSKGINYDRLGLIFFGDIEIWRTTTAMPTRTGIYWNFLKDMTVFDTLLRSEQKVIMELDNIYDAVFTGAYNYTITALYYNDHQSISPADTILPISAQMSSQNKSSIISLPDGNASAAWTFPRNVERAVVSISASGNGAEEFWYTNVPTEYIDTFNNSAIYGYSPFREVQLLVDDRLAGVSWPFPIIFTGGISPGLWVPIVGSGTYDLPTFEIDISPFLGILCDGKPHVFQLKVVGYDPKTLLGTVGSNWWVSGAIFLWVDSTGHQTTGTALKSTSPEPAFKFSSLLASNGTSNTSLWVQLDAAREISHSATIKTSSGSQHLTWSQTLSYTNTQNFTASGYNETLHQLTSGASTFSSYQNYSPITNTFSYPLSFYQANIVPNDPITTNSTLIAILDRSVLSTSKPILSYLTAPKQFEVPGILSTRQNGSCIYGWNNTYYEFAGAIDPAMGTMGGTEQWYSYQGPVAGSKRQEGYGRYVKAVDGYEPVLLIDETVRTGIEVPETKPVAY